MSGTVDEPQGRYRWTQPICIAHWQERNPDAPPPTTILPAYRVVEVCCDCGTLTRDGIYIRVNPRSVLYPTLREQITL